MVGVAADGRVALFHVEPPSVPPLQRGVQRYSDVLTRHPVAELKIHAADHSGIATALLLQLEQVSEEVEVGENSKIHLAEMDKNRDVQDGVWMEIAQTHSLELQKVPQERMNRKS